MKATRIFHHKALLHGDFVLELAINQVDDSIRYPDGIKYSLVCVHTKTGRRVLFDNHHPKGPHLHLDAFEVDYLFVDVPTLMADFKRMVSEHLGVKL